MNRLRRFVSRHGWTGLMRFLAYPVTTLITTPVRLVQTLWACRVLADGKWGDYNCFTPNAAINSLFYWTQALNFSRYGRSGKSPTTGLGGYPLSRWFHNSLVSLYAYWRAGNVTVLMSMFGWLAFHLLWLKPGNAGWIALGMALALISTTFYSQTFSRQNYNAVGWLFFPMGLYGLMTGNWGIAAWGWLLASFGSSTAMIIAGLLTLSQTLLIWDVGPLLAFLPAALKLATHFWPNVCQGDLWKTLATTFKAIGTTRKKVRYERPGQWGNIVGWYLCVLYAQFGICGLVLGMETGLFWTGFGIYFLNHYVSRFADEQSTQMAMFSLATAMVLQWENGWAFISYWLLASPVPYLAGFYKIKLLDIVPRLKPFHVQPLLEGMDRFLVPVGKGQRVWMAFRDPRGNYNNIFDGYRNLLEVPFHSAALREIHLLPDWWAVFETNYEGAPEIWGHEPEAVRRNVERWKADFVIVYQEGDAPLEGRWEDAGFQPLTRFRWKDHDSLLQGTLLPRPTWWLLKAPAK